MKRLAILLLLLATTTQAFVAQTHVHAGFATQSSAHGLSELADPAVGDERFPAGGDHGNCLLCQIAAHGATALASHQSGIPQAAQRLVFAAHRYAPDPRSLPPTHTWSSRGPPRS